MLIYALIMLKTPFRVLVKLAFMTDINFSADPMIITKPPYPTIKQTEFQYTVHPEQ